MAFIIYFSTITLGCSISFIHLHETGETGLHVKPLQCLINCGLFFFFFASRAEMQMEVNGDQAVVCVCASLSSPGIWSKCWSGTWIALSRQSTRITYSRCWRWGIHEGNLDLLPFIYLRMFVRQKWIFLSSFCFRIRHVSFDPSVSHAARKFNQQKPRASGAGDPHHFILMMYAEMYCRPVSVDE